MAATFTEISLEEMEKFLKRGFRILRPKKSTERGEIYFDLSLSPNVVVRVWTSIGASNSSAADAGADAIRVQLMSAKTRRPLMKGKAPIVKRTQGWKANLQERIEDLIETYEDKDEYWESRADPGWAPRPDSAPEHDHSPNHRPQEDDSHTDLDDRTPDPSQPVEEERKAPVLDTPPRPRSPVDLKGTFTKLRNGDWGLRVEGVAEPGDRVLARRASGQTTWLTVGEIVWKGQDRGTGGMITVCTIARNGRTASDSAEDTDYNRSV